MGLTLRGSKLERQINVKVSNEIYQRYQALREDASKKDHDFSLQPEFDAWLNGFLAACEKKLAKPEKEQPEKSSRADASA